VLTVHESEMIANEARMVLFSGAVLACKVDCGATTRTSGSHSQAIDLRDEADRAIFAMIEKPSDYRLLRIGEGANQGFAELPPSLICEVYYCWRSPN
jgi:hypothetical protein